MKILVKEFFTTLSRQIKNQIFVLSFLGIIIFIYSVLIFFSTGFLNAFLFMLLTSLSIFIVMFIAYIILEYPGKVFFKKSLSICELVNANFVKLDANSNLKRKNIEICYNDFISQNLPSKKVLVTWKYYLSRDLMRYVLIIPTTVIGLKYSFNYLYEYMEGLVYLFSDGKFILSDFLNGILNQSGFQISESGMKFFYYIYLLTGYYSHIERINVTVKQIEFMLDTQ